MLKIARGAGHLPDLGSDAFDPPSGRKSRAMLINGQCVVSMRVIDSQVSFQKLEMLFIHMREEGQWNTQRANRIPHAPWNQIGIDCE